ncbi:MAG: glycosyltransferase [Bdellovibrionaceae bacterium]|nr:glycosyltransferase [Bdellovibrionales bacterium]MCB9255243.1 glycosyltransferase [Pseudobdellovibrionaceae bacterium]
MISSPKRVAIVHDWLTGERGGEKVLRELLALFPQAEIFTLFYDSQKFTQTYLGHPVHTSFLQLFPGIGKYYRYLLPLFPMAIERLDLRGYDLVISSSHCVAKGVITDPESTHISYCHTPMRYVWDCYHDYFPPGFKENLMAPFLHYLRTWDAASAGRVDEFIANSQFVRQRIGRYYRREASVIYPPVDTEFFHPGTDTREDFYLVVSAFAPYKRIDIAIEACRRLERRVVVVGDGQDASTLLRHNNPQLEFTGRISLSRLRGLYRTARALLFPGKEDFGIVPVEALACGTPVVAYGVGGASETVLDGKTGVLFSEQTPAALTEAIKRFEKLEIESIACRQQAERFSKLRFQKELRAFFDTPMSGKPKQKTRQPLREEPSLELR